MTSQWITFSVEEERYGLPIERVREVLRADGLHQVQDAPAHVRGVQELRGADLPVLDLRTRLGLPQAAIAPSSRILVAEARGKQVGLLIDGAHEVETLPGASIRATPMEVRSRFSGHVAGVATLEDHLLLLLDLDQLLSLPAHDSDEPSP